MNQLLRIIDRGDVCNLGLVIVLLLFVGNALADEQQRKLGAMVAALSLVAYGVYGFVSRPPRSDEQLLDLTLRGLSAAGLTLGASWVLFPLVTSVWQYLVRSVWQVPRRWFTEDRGQAERRRLHQAEQRQLDEQRERQQAQQEAERHAREEAQRQSEQAARAREETQKRETAERADVRVAADKWFTENAPYLPVTPSRMRAWVAVNLADDVPVKEQWAALESFIAQYEEAVERAKDKQQSRIRINPEDV